ncbi:hypothetical protein K1T71_006333 [Dendrolimus kikuchii]|uniref:Uncharacterized protein n=1 Tax=Dendrolimus kikuchii TaxID=765133 RepID=A0ACC1D3W5_9NEOP|nr:hypothetical protein K1T71_006333 [Dendrolimus kikuchii]
MTERCQSKYKRQIENNNYLYSGIICTTFAVLYFYRFHLATIVFSYVLGCLACYYALNTTFLHKLVYKLKCHFLGESVDEEIQETPSTGCITCGCKDCDRHDASNDTEPWVGLHIHKQLDQAIEDFYNTILDQFINSWYNKITLQPFFVDELRHQLRYASACLLQRAVKINYSRFVTERLLPCALHHYTVCSDIADGAPLLDSKLALHPAAANRNAELKYLRCITNAIMPYLLKNNELQNSVSRVLVREIFAGWVLLSLTDILADPYILNTLIILATGDETMAQLPTTPNYKVEFLETFVRQTDSVYMQRSKLLKIDLELVINDQEYFYAFMQYMKTTNHIHLLQFYKDIKSFQIRILNPDLSSDENELLRAEACDMYALYLSEGSASRVPLEPAFADELHSLLQSEDCIKRLQTSRALYQVARQTHSVLEKIMLPRFLHSEEFYKMMIGSLLPPGYHKFLVKRPQDKLINTALKLGNKLKNAIKSQTLDGQVLDIFTNPDDLEGDGDDNMDILKYLDSVAAEESLSSNDLSTYKVVLTNVETRLQAPPRRGTVRVFTLAVHRVESGAAASFWTVERSEHDFHLLRSKLHEFHGDRLLLDLPLPSRRDNSPLETIRYKYEDFLQRLLQKSLLQTSELLRIFLTEDGDFSLVVQALTLNANNTDLTNIYQSVTHKLRKEKGQHLESFMRNLLVSSDMERYQALKHGTAREVEEAQEVSEDIEVELLQVKRQKRARNIHNSTFGNNFDVEPNGFELSTSYQDIIVGFTQCFMYLLIKVFNVRSFLSGVVGNVLGMCRVIIDDAFNRYLNRTLGNVLCERRLAHLIRLGHNLLFGKNANHSRVDPYLHRELARTHLQASIPSPATLLAGPGVQIALHKAFEIVQRPQLNKQLVYNLLDLCVSELFPELRPIGSEGPKS